LGWDDVPREPYVTPSTNSVVICTYSLERWSDLANAVTAASAQAGSGTEIVLVVDHNPALAARAAAEWPAARVVESTWPRGVSGSRNAGVEAAQGEVVVFLDDDARPEPGWLEELTGPYADPAVVGTGGKAIADWETGRPRWFPDEFDWVVGCSYRGLPDHKAAVRNPLGCNMSFRRDALVAVGLFRTDLGGIGQLPIGGDETELSIRIHAREPHRRIIYVPEARVLHHVPPQRATWRYFVKRCYQEGRPKAAIRAMSRGGPALDTELAYTLQTLPRGVIRGLADTLRGHPWGLARALAIIIGLGVTTAAFAVGTIRPPRVKESAVDDRAAN
jgi:cellulose synthase/poly-beta-1,6-N-acetylglucosamine synthase-like glycosyltransferase